MDLDIGNARRLVPEEESARENDSKHDFFMQLPKYFFILKNQDNNYLDTLKISPFIPRKFSSKIGI